MLDDTDKLSDARNAFYEKTEILPAVITIYNETWMNSYASLEEYS